MINCDKFLFIYIYQCNLLTINFVQFKDYKCTFISKISKYLQNNIGILNFKLYKEISQKQRVSLYKTLNFLNIALNLRF